MNSLKIFSLPVLLMSFAGHAASLSSTTTQKSAVSASKPTVTQLATVSLSSVQLRDNSYSGNNTAISYSRKVQLTLNTGGKVVQYRAGENPQLNGASWKSYKTNQRLLYQFVSDSDGNKTVYVQVRGISTSPSTYSAIVSDSIQYRKLPQIVNFRIDNGAASATKREVGLNWSVTGTATHYRVSETPNFSGSNWVSGATPPGGRLAFDLGQGASGTRTVYLELKRDNSPVVRSSDSINISFGICPIGHRGLECSGAGICNANGSCDCNSDISGTACTTVCQRCYGALGNNCGPADGLEVLGENLGICGNTPLGRVCQINAGSWAHDECCILHRRGGPNSQQGSCNHGPPPRYCLGDLAKAIIQAPNPLLTWTRKVDFSKASCTEGLSMRVNHADMCNPKGGTLLCSDRQYCCSRRAHAAPVQPNAAVGGTLCVCD
jgi:hypothetical protein